MQMGGATLSPHGEDDDQLKRFELQGEITMLVIVLIFFLFLVFLLLLPRLNRYRNSGVSEPSGSGYWR